jgi:hypothetical protein
MASSRRERRIVVSDRAPAQTRDGIGESLRLASHSRRDSARCARARDVRDRTLVAR